MTTEEAIKTIEVAIAEVEWNYSMEYAVSFEKAIAALRARQEMENPKPLTLDELREMGGEPVWVCPAKHGGEIHERWMLLSGFREELDLYLFCPSSGISQGYNGVRYGKTWLAYRHKPKEALKSES